MAVDTAPLLPGPTSSSSPPCEMLHTATYAALSETIKYALHFIIVLIISRGNNTNAIASLGLIKVTHDLFTASFAQIIQPIAYTNAHDSSLSDAERRQAVVDRFHASLGLSVIFWGISFLLAYTIKPLFNAFSVAPEITELVAQYYFLSSLASNLPYFVTKAIDELVSGEVKNKQFALFLRNAINVSITLFGAVLHSIEHTLTVKDYAVLVSISTWTNLLLAIVIHYCTPSLGQYHLLTCPRSGPLCKETKQLLHEGFFDRFIPSFLDNILNKLTNLYIAALGATPLAVASALDQFCAIFSVFFRGGAKTLEVHTAYEEGQNHLRQVRLTARYGITIGSVLMLLLAGIFYMSPANIPLIGIFLTNTELQHAHELVAQAGTVYGVAACADVSASLFISGITGFGNSAATSSHDPSIATKASSLGLLAAILIMFWCGSIGKVDNLTGLYTASMIGKLIQLMMSGTAYLLTEPKLTNHEQPVSSF